MSFRHYSRMDEASARRDGKSLKPLSFQLHHPSYPQNPSIASPRSSFHPRIAQRARRSQPVLHSCRSSRSSDTISPSDSPLPSQTKSPSDIFAPDTKPEKDLVLAASTRELVLNLQERIAFLELSYTNISLELEASRDALTRKQPMHTSNYLLTHSDLVDKCHGRVNARTDAGHKRMSGDGVSKEDAEPTRTLRKREELCTALAIDLQTDQMARKYSQDDMAQQFSTKHNWFEHSNSFAACNSAPQNAMLSSITKSHADTWMSCLLEVGDGDRLVHSPKAKESQRRPIEFKCHTTCSNPIHDSLDLTYSDRSPSIPTQLMSTQDKLHVTQTHLSASIRQCEILTERLASLQANMTLCLDETARALEVERELRAEIELRVQGLLEENKALRAGKVPRKDEPEQTRPCMGSRGKLDGFEGPWKTEANGTQDDQHDNESLGRVDDRKHLPRVTTRRIVEKQDINLRTERREWISDQQLRDGSSTRELEHSMTAPYEGNSRRHPTIVATPPQTPTSSKHHRMSGILATTLSKNPPPAQAALKTESIVSVDITCVFEVTPPSFDKVELAPSISADRYLKRASAAIGKSPLKRAQV